MLMTPGRVRMAMESGKTSITTETETGETWTEERRETLMMSSFVTTSGTETSTPTTEKIGLSTALMHQEPLLRLRATLKPLTPGTRNLWQILGSRLTSLTSLKTVRLSDLEP